MAKQANGKTYTDVMLSWKDSKGVTCKIPLSEDKKGSLNFRVFAPDDKAGVLISRKGFYLPRGGKKKSKAKDPE